MCPCMWGGGTGDDPRTEAGRKARFPCSLAPAVRWCGPALPGWGVRGLVRTSTVVLRAVAGPRVPGRLG